MFGQVIDFQMGSDPAPFLYYYENTWVHKHNNVDLNSVRLFHNIFSFIDDLAAVNDGGEFESSYKEIYPPEPDLKKKKRSFLCLGFFQIFEDYTF